jgi:PleD family two-component response regulator
MSILIVDDTPAVAALIAGLLVAAGFGEPIVVHDAVEALRLLGVEPKAAPQIAVDLVLMDILMPEVDGIDACARLKADPRLADLPVIMISTLSNAGTLRQAFAAGAVDYIAKPIQADELAARVGSALRTRRALDGRLVEGAAPVDPVTGLPTAPVLAAALDSVLGHEGAGALVLLGLGGWSRHATANGPAATDRAARRVADRLAALFGSLGDLLVRLDAGRFALLCRPATDAVEVAEGLCRHVADLGIQSADGQPVTATAAILHLDTLAAGVTGAQAIALAAEKLAVQSGNEPAA